MKKYRLTKQQEQERQIIKNSKFSKYLLISFSLFFLALILVFIFYTYWHDTKYTYRKFALYGKEVPKEAVCMSGDNIHHHESLKVEYENHIYFVCSTQCHQHLKDHYREIAYTQDAFSGDTICKSDALIGLKERGKANVVYFDNHQNFRKYYEAKTSK